MCAYNLIFVTQIKWKVHTGTFNSSFLENRKLNSNSTPECGIYFIYLFYWTQNSKKFMNWFWVENKNAFSIWIDFEFCLLNSYKLIWIELYFHFNSPLMMNLNFEFNYRENSELNWIQINKISQKIIYFCLFSWKMCTISIQFN